MTVAMFNFADFDRTRFPAYEHLGNSRDSSSLNSLPPTSMSASVEQSAASKSHCWVLKLDEEL